MVARWVLSRAVSFCLCYWRTAFTASIASYRLHATSKEEYPLANRLRSALYLIRDLALELIDPKVRCCTFVFYSWTGVRGRTVADHRVTDANMDVSITL